ncbi:MAG: hypothetical protein H6738_12765 [Alphaproteobacteria bacterium]|nr:hypothetical protein [Alphaproteobacteria bacterium]MCB9697646.1 hypothetical protein [Alphaproteobacteria bacterium]
MKQTITAVIVGSTLLLTITNAHASGIAWSDPVSRQPQITWTSASVEEARASLALRGTVFEDGDRERIGPGGGVLLATWGHVAIEVDENGLVEGIGIREDGTIGVRRTLFDAFAAGASVFKKNGTTQVMVTATLTKTADSAALLTGQGDARPQVQFDVVIHEGAEIVDQVSLAYDARTLVPVVSSKTLKTYTEGGGVPDYEMPLVYWF